MNARRKKPKDFVSELAASLPADRVARARKHAEEDIFRIRLGDLRREAGVRQEDLKHFSQPSISRIESRQDMKISTLLEYLEDIGMSVEIRVYPKKRKKGEIILLKR